MWWWNLAIDALNALKTFLVPSLSIVRDCFGRKLTFIVAIIWNFGNSLARTGWANTKFKIAMLPPQLEKKFLPTNTDSSNNWKMFSFFTEVFIAIKLWHYSIRYLTKFIYIFYWNKKGAQGQMRQKSLEFWHIFNTGKIWCMQKGKRIVKGIKSIILKSESPRS